MTYSIIKASNMLSSRSSILYIIIFIVFASTINNLVHYYRYNTTYIFEVLIHRIINPLLVMDSPESWQGPLPPLDELFPNNRILEDNWKVIRDEALSIYNSSLLEPAYKTSPAAFASLSRYSKDKTKVFWKTSIIKFYGREFPDVMNAVPHTVELLDRLPNVDLAMFSVMEPGATIPVHRGPMRGAVRYHLPLIVPGYDINGEALKDIANSTQSHCHIIVGEDISQHYGRIRNGKPTTMIEGTEFANSFPTYKHSWIPGKGVLFDDTYPHSVANHHPDKSKRIVLFLDVRRPYPTDKIRFFHIGTFLFSFIRWTGLPVYLFFKNAKNEKTVITK